MCDVCDVCVCVRAELTDITLSFLEVAFHTILYVRAGCAAYPRSMPIHKHACMEHGLLAARVLRVCVCARVLRCVVVAGMHAACIRLVRPARAFRSTATPFTCLLLAPATPCLRTECMIGSVCRGV
ncbi:hypothetical protein EON66_07750 [archaeon]|nr:MAG: hypothetical protein EON66_07750 [archaeon]